MNRELYLVVSPRRRDLAALTAEETIRKRVPGGEALARLDRADLWEFDFDGTDAFRPLLEKLVRESNLFVNPNKHVFRFAEDFRTGWREECVLVVVRGKEDLEGAVAEETLRSRYQLPGLRGVRYAALWVLGLEAPARGETIGPGGTLALAESLAVATGPGGGLLVNPHYQTYEIERARAEEGSTR